MGRVEKMGRSRNKSGRISDWIFEKKNSRISFKKFLRIGFRLGQLKIWPRFQISLIGEMTKISPGGYFRGNTIFLIF